MTASQDILFTLFRVNDDGDSTIGHIVANDKLVAYTLEDPHREEKIKSKTRIPSGFYEIKKREVLSGLTKRYRDRFDWFDYHLELQGVPGFKYVYLHIGNDSDDTDGCILVGLTQIGNIAGKRGFIGNSTDAFERIYRQISGYLDKGKRVYIQVKDEANG